MFGAVSRLIIIHVSCDSADKEKEANITSIQLNDSAVFDNKSHSVKWLVHIIRFRVCFVQVDNELLQFFFYNGLSRLYTVAVDIKGYKHKYSMSRNC